MNKNNEIRHAALRDALCEASRFIARADKAMDELETDHWVYSSSAMADAKRASMDLSKALVKVRKAQSC